MPSTKARALGAAEGKKLKTKLYQNFRENEGFWQVKYHHMAIKLQWFDQFSIPSINSLAGVVKASAVNHLDHLHVFKF